MIKYQREMLDELTVLERELFYTAREMSESEFEKRKFELMFKTRAFLYPEIGDIKIKIQSK